MSDRSHLRGSRILPALLVPFLAGSAADAPVAGELDAIRYSIHVDAGSSEPWTWQVLQGPEIVEVREGERMWAADASGREEIEWRLSMLSGPELDGVPHTIDEEWGLLTPVWSQPRSLAGGNRVDNGFGVLTAYDSVRFELSRGDRDDAVEGREAEHWVLTATAWGRVAQEGEEESRLESAARADLWFDPHLPFTAVPFALARSVALPLGQVDQTAAHYVGHQAMPELRKRGLLVRAEISSRQVQHVEWQEEPMATEPAGVTLWTDPPQAVAEPPRAEDYLPRYPVLDAARAEALELTARMTFACDAGSRVDAGSSLEGDVAGRKLKGGAAFQSEPFPFTLVLATPPDGSSGTCLVVLAADAPATGSRSAVAPDLASLSAGQPPEGTFWAASFGGDAERRSRRILVVDSGRLEIRSASPGRVEGTLRLDGWGVERASDDPGELTRLVEDARVEVSFVALPSAPE